MGLFDWLKQREPQTKFDGVPSPEVVLQAWREQDLFAEVDSDGLQLRIGAPNPNVPSHVPAPLRALLSAMNGFNIDENTSGRAEASTEQSVRDVWNGLLPADEIEPATTSDQTFTGLKIGVAYAQSQLLLAKNGAVVFDDAKGPARVVASDLQTFMKQWARRGFSVEAVVSDAE